MQGRRAHSGLDEHGAKCEGDDEQLNEAVDVHLPTELSVLASAFVCILFSHGGTYRKCMAIDMSS